MNTGTKEWYVNHEGVSLVWWAGLLWAQVAELLWGEVKSTREQKRKAVKPLSPANHQGHVSVVSQGWPAIYCCWHSCSSVTLLHGLPQFSLFLFPIDLQSLAAEHRDLAAVTGAAAVFLELCLHSSPWSHFSLVQFHNLQFVQVAVLVADAFSHCLQPLQNLGNWRTPRRKVLQTLLCQTHKRCPLPIARDRPAQSSPTNA